MFPISQTPMNPIERISGMSSRGGRAKGLTNLVETDVGGLLTEALTADVHLYKEPN